MRFFDFGEGTVKSVEGKDFLLSSKNLIDYQLNVKPGDELKNPRYGRLRPGHFIIGNEDYESLKLEAKEIIDKVRVVFD
jgi:carbamoyl-phosphate synthase large subunit